MSGNYLLSPLQTEDHLGLVRGTINFVENKYTVQLTDKKLCLVSYVEAKLHELLGDNYDFFKQEYQEVLD